MPPKSLHVHRLPSEVPAEEFQGTVTVVVDILRATSTMTTALASGAGAIVPYAEIDDAREHFRQFPDNAKLCGERNWAMIPGFHCGNSPGDYEQNVAGRTFIFTTTNGTKALHHASAASRICLGSFLNISTLESMLSRETDVRILCSGTKGEPSWEDQLFAGALADRLTDGDHGWNDVASEVVAAWREFQSQQTDADDLFKSLCTGTGGSNLVKRGLERDIRYCAQMDRFDVVAEFFANENVIRLSNQPAT